jgi:hypothetical protein
MNTNFNIEFLKIFRYLLKIDPNLAKIYREYFLEFYPEKNFYNVLDLENEITKKVNLIYEDEIKQSSKEKKLTLNTNNKYKNKFFYNIDKSQSDILDLLKYKKLEINSFLKFYTISKTLIEYICLYIVSIHFELVEYKNILLIKITKKKFGNKKILSELLKIFPQENYHTEISGLIKNLKSEFKIS